MTDAFGFVNVLPKAGNDPKTGWIQYLSKQ